MINIPVSVPAASSLGPHRSIPRRDVNTSNRVGGGGNSPANSTDDNFNPDNIFEDIETQPSNPISDSDLDRLLGPPPRRKKYEQQPLEQEGTRERRGHGNMIVVCPRCLHRGFGIMGPHWYVYDVFSVILMQQQNDFYTLTL
jgi:hypothetical protein